MRERVMMLMIARTIMTATLAGMGIVNFPFVPLEGVVVHVGVGVQVVVVMVVQLVVGESSVWLRSGDGALVIVTLAVVASGKMVLVVSIGVLVGVDKGDATEIERNAARKKRIV